MSTRFDSETKQMGVPVGPGDAMIVRVGGGAGYGDPVDRPAGQVASDIRNGYVPAGPGEEFYGVKLTDGEIDEKATEELRQARRTERMRWDVPEAYSGPDAPAGGERTSIHPALDRIGSGADAVTVCRRCDTALARDGEDFRPHLAARRTLASELARQYGADVIARPGVDLIERACPGCGTMIAVDLTIEA